MSAEDFREPEEEIPGPPLTYPIYLTAEQLITLRYVLQRSKSDFEHEHRSSNAALGLGPAPSRWLAELIRDIEDLQRVVGQTGVPSASNERQEIGHTLANATALVTNTIFFIKEKGWQDRFLPWLEGAEKKIQQASALLSGAPAADPPQAPKLLKHPSYGDLFPIEEFKGMQDSGMVIPGDDGGGYWATADGYAEGYSIRKPKPEWATHVLWFNK